MKVVSLREDNFTRGLPLVSASILHMDASTGVVDAVVAGSYMTGLRTASGSALSCQSIKPEARSILCFGAGLQAELHVRCIAEALDRPLDVKIVNRSIDRARSLQSKLQLDFPDSVSSIEVIDGSRSDSLNEAFAAAEIVVTCTNTLTPLFDGSLLAPGTHICGVGSYTPQMQEVSESAVDRCRIIIDTPEAKEVGDLRKLRDGHPCVLLGTILESESNPRIDELKEEYSHLDCTFYKSVGTAIQDVLTTELVVRTARALGLGTEVDMS